MPEQPGGWQREHPGLWVLELDSTRSREVAELG